MRIENLISEEVKKQLKYQTKVQEVKSKPIDKPKPKKRMSRRELEELMDVNKQIFRRKNGAWRGY